MAAATSAIRPLPALVVGGFRDRANHWRHLRDTNRVIQPLPKQAAYAPTQVREIAANILLFQRANGGWTKDYDMLAVLVEEQCAARRAARNRADPTFDNHALIEAPISAFIAVRSAALPRERSSRIHGRAANRPGEQGFQRDDCSDGDPRRDAFRFRAG